MRREKPIVSFDYSGSHVLITGGTGGIGAGIAAAYRAAGADVTVTGTRAHATDYDPDLSAYRYLQLDLEDSASIERMAASLSELDILVHSAGVALPAFGLDEYEPEVFERAVRMHLTGVYRLSRACSDALKRSHQPGGASVVAMASMASYFAVEIVPGYGAAKAGLVQMVKTLAVHWASASIRVNAVAPSLTESHMTRGVVANPELTAPTLARTPMGRLGQPDDIAGVVMFLTSPLARYVTGQTLPVDGGYSVVG